MSKGTPLKCIRVPDALWDQFAEMAKAGGADRSTVLREFMRWYVREAGAKLPERPTGPQ